MGAEEITAIIKDVVLGLSAAVVAIFAWIGLKTWRREMTGKAKFETARNMIRLGYKLKSDFEQARSPFTSAHEWAGRAVQDNESVRESQVLNEWYARGSRLNSVAESLGKMIEVQWESEILFDAISAQYVGEAIDSYRKSFANLASAVSDYFDIRRNEAETGIKYNNRHRLKELRRTVYSEAPDSFSWEISYATDRLNSALVQYVR